jgi:hypothetical protein
MRIKLDRLNEVKVQVNKKRYNLLVPLPYRSVFTWLSDLTQALQLMTQQRFRWMCILSGCDYLPAHSGGSIDGWTV